MVPAGDRADAWIVPAMLDGTGPEMALFLVARGAAGASSAGHLCQDGSRAANVTLVNTPATLLTRDGLRALQQAIDVGTAALCAQAVGVMDKTLALTAEYLNTRKQFGVAIASFQALRHRLADVKMQVELARSMSYYATLKLNAPDAERSHGHVARQGATGPVHALRGPTVGATAWRHWGDRRVHRQPLLQNPHADGNDLRRHPAPPGQGE
jgi:alkylation response protein AidB-like acyl-CoA dehydrogenase